MTRETPPHYRETTPQPEVAKRARDVVFAVEAATAAEPATLDMIAGPKYNYSLAEMLDGQLRAIDELWDRHEALFFREDAPLYGVRESADLDYEAIRDLSLSTIKAREEEADSYRGVLLGLSVLQLAAGGARLAQEPAVGVVNLDTKHDVGGALAHRGGKAAADAFTASFPGCWKGDAFSLPAARLSYMRDLMDTHLAFWENKLHLLYTGLDDMRPDLRDMALKIIPRFPEKVLREDIHSLRGRPPRSFLKKGYVRLAEAAIESTQRVSSGADFSGNLAEIGSFIVEALDTAIAEGYTPAESLRIVAQNALVLSELVDRTATGRPSPGNDKHMMHLSGDRENPVLTIDYPPAIAPSTYSEALIERLHARAERGSVCPARSLVQITAGGKTHQHLLTFTEGVREQFGTQPLILQEIGGKTYADPALLITNYALLSHFR